MIAGRFDKHVLELLNEDELALLYMLYNKLFDRENVDLRCVFVQPILNEIKKADDQLTSEGKEVRNRIVAKIKSYFNP